jgi:hypothetical protein
MEWQDGVKECDVLRRMGARIFVQDEATRVVGECRGSSRARAWPTRFFRSIRSAGEIVRATTMQIAARTHV